MNKIIVGRSDASSLLEGMMTYIMVDVETDGPIPADFSMVCFGAVIVDDTLNKTFYGQTSPHQRELDS